MAIRGGNEGGLDGVDIWSTNIHVHDVTVTNKDECVTVKSPSKNILIENVYCNWSGGCALGSLGADTDISDVVYRNIYLWNCNEMMMIKSNGGSGTVQNVVFENFIGHGNAYSLDIDQYWSSMSTVAGDGVQLSGITVTNWTGTEANGAQRGPIKVACADGAPCTNVTISDFAMWTETGSSQFYTCRSAYGEGFCLKSGSGSEYAAVTTTVKTAPSGYSAPTMAADLKTAFGTAASIPIPTIPTSFFPGETPLSKLAGAAAAASASTSQTTKAAVVAKVSATSSVASSSTSAAMSSVKTSVKSSAHSTAKSSATSAAKSTVKSSVKVSSTLVTRSHHANKSVPTKYAAAAEQSSNSAGTGCDVVYVTV